MRPVQGEAGEGTVPAGVRGFPVVARPEPGAALPLPLGSPHVGWWLVPLWGGVGAPHVSGPCQDPTLETQSLSPKGGSPSHSGIPGRGDGAGGAPETRAWLEACEAEDTSRGGGGA